MAVAGVVVATEYEQECMPLSESVAGLASLQITASATGVAPADPGGASWTDVTELLATATGELAVGELLHNRNFSL